MVISANEYAMYHLTKLDGTRIRTPVAGKQMKAFKRRNEAERDPAVGAESSNSEEEDE